MNTKICHSVIIFILSYLFYNPLYAINENGYDLAEEDWLAVKDKTNRLDELTYLPSFLPIIMKNHNTLQLTKKQISLLHAWRQQYYLEMVLIRNEIITEELNFKKAERDIEASRNDFYDIQDTIQNLQKELLQIRLSYKKVIMHSHLTHEQLNNLVLILEGNPTVASVIQY